MKTKQSHLYSLFAVILIASFALAFTACGDDDDPDNTDTEENGDVSVTGVTLNKTTLNLAVGGTETLTATVAPANATNKAVTWSSSNTAVATVSGGTATGVSAGTATITVTTVDGNKTAQCVVTVTPVPENLPYADRWYKWANEWETNPVTLDYSIADDDVCTITVGGTAQSELWQACAGYYYTAKANTYYEYKFEAWTQSENRTINVQYYNADADQIWLGEKIDLTTERKTYTINGEKIPKAAIWSVQFQCGNQLGTFYVKMISITEYTPALSGTYSRTLDDDGDEAIISFTFSSSNKYSFEIKWLDDPEDIETFDDIYTLNGNTITFIFPVDDDVNIDLIATLSTDKNSFAIATQASLVGEDPDEGDGQFLIGTYTKQ